MMNSADILLNAKKIAENYVKSNSCLNESIAKIAIKNNLSKDKIERLVEEVNKATFLLLLETKGEQQFPVADYSEIKKKMVPSVEKTASALSTFEKLVYSNDKFKSLLGNCKTMPTMTKEASVKQYEDKEIAHFEALRKVASEYMSNYNKLMDLEALAYRRYGYSNDIMKTAEVNSDKEILNIRTIESELTKQAEVFEVILNSMEKMAGFFGELNPILAALKTNGGPLKRTAHAAGALINLGTKAAIGTPFALAGGAAKTALKGAALTAPVAVPLALTKGVKNIGTTLTVATEGGKAIANTKAAVKTPSIVGPISYIAKSASIEKEAFLAPLLQSGVKLFQSPLAQSALKWGGRISTASNVAGKLTQPLQSIGPGLVATASEGLSKEANVSGILNSIFGNQNRNQHITEFAGTALAGGMLFKDAFPLGMLGGMGIAAARKLGGGIALTMNQKEFDRSFDTIMKNNPELSEDKKKVREYFDVVARHAPSLAKDPLVAESLVKNMNAFGGIDFNTVATLRKTEAEGADKPNEFNKFKLSPFSFSGR